MAIHIDSRGAGTDVVLIGGTPKPPSHWEPLRAELGPGFRTHVVHLPGYGEGTAPPEPGDLEGVEAEIARRLEELGVERPVLVGYSGGSYRSFALALRGVPCRGIVGLAPMGHLERARGESLLGVADALEAGIDVREAVLPALFGSRTRERSPDAVTRWAEEILAAAKPATMRAEIRAYMARDLCPSLGGIEVPVVLRGGRDDPGVTPENVQALAALLPNATVEIVDGASHCLHLEDLQATAESIRALA